MSVNRLLALGAFALLATFTSAVSSTADAQVIGYRSATPVVTYYAPSAPIAAAPFAMAPVAAPIMVAPSTITSTYYRGRAYTNAPRRYRRAPVVTYYRAAPVMVQAAPAVAPTQAAVPQTTYYAPAYSQAAPVPMAVAPAAPHAVYYNPGVIITRPVYVPGQPIRNLFR